MSLNLNFFIIMNKWTPLFRVNEIDVSQQVFLPLYLRVCTKYFKQYLDWKKYWQNFRDFWSIGIC